ncbi:MAG: ParB/RepB/Spo0J family partition protein [Ruminococcaceae bacterium]|nr:ParB/RepB/Spo0J family partition protein [Oscillospiraceae bacterium]
MAVKRSALGKGLGALIKENTTVEAKNSVIEVDINKIEPGVGQPRKNFDKEKIEALAESIKEHGIIQPLIVTKENDTYYIIAGERRWRAARVAGIKKIPVIERTATTKEVMELALIENIQREDLNPVEEAEAYQKLMEEFSMTQDQVASIVGKSRPAVANTLRLLNLSKDVRGFLISGELTVGQARPLLSIVKAKDQKVAAEYIVKAGLNARQVEQYVKRISSKTEEVKNNDDSEKDIINKQEIKFVQDKLRASLGTKVLLSDNKGKGKITIEYYSEDERERLIELLTSK